MMQTLGVILFWDDVRAQLNGLSIEHVGIVDSTGVQFVVEGDSVVTKLLLT